MTLTTTHRTAGGNRRPSRSGVGFTMIDPRQGPAGAGPRLRSTKDDGEHELSEGCGPQENSWGHPPAETVTSQCSLDMGSSQDRIRRHPYLNWIGPLSGSTGEFPTAFWTQTRQ